jgi:alpha-galactosidase
MSVASPWILSGEKSARTDPKRRPDFEIPCAASGQSFAFGRYEVRLSVDRLDLPGLKRLRLGLRRQAGGERGRFDFGWLRLRGLPLPKELRAVLANGHNGWSHSPLLGRHDVLRGETNPLQETFGDHDYYRYPEEPGLVHSWSFAYGDCGKAGTIFFGSTDERHFYSVFEFDLNAGQLSIAVETAGFDFDHPAAPAVDHEGFSPLGEWILPDETPVHPPLHTAARVWMQRIVAIDPERRPAFAREQVLKKLGEQLPVRGYTSWYYRYTDIDAAWLLANLGAVSERRDWRVFQIDDGYQAAIGDWLSPKSGFPGGVAPVLAAARDKGMTPGLWCAPFVATSGSELYREHAQWLQRRDDGELVLCGDFPHWGGKFYALDLENAGLRSHLEGILTTMCDAWGAGFLKTDFLYAAGRAPGGGLTRAARAARAHAWLFRLCAAHETLLLSCGAIVSSALGLCHFSRIGADVGPKWEASIPAHQSREQVHTRASVVNTVTRAFLSGLAFGNDPDVFILRDQGTSMSQAERLTLLRANQMLGDLVFSSDYLPEYGAWQHQSLAEAEGRRNASGSFAAAIASVSAPSPGTLVVESAAGRATIQLGEDGGEPAFDCAAP